MRRSAAFVLSSLLSLGAIGGLAQSAPLDDRKSGVASSQEDEQTNTPSGIEILSDTEGVDFAPYIKAWHRITAKTWDKLIPAEVNPPTLRKGAVAIRFKILPNGKIMDHSMVLEGRSGDAGLDRAAWFALTNSKYPSMPPEFHGAFLEVRALFLYNMQPTKK